MAKFESLTAALEAEVLTEMAGTFFGARKGMDDLIEDFHLHVEELRSQEARVFSRVFFLRSLLLGPGGEAALFAALGLEDPFAAAGSRSGSRTWTPDGLPFALFPRTRFAKAVLLAYAEVHKACQVYMSGEYVDDPDRRGRKKLTLHYKMLERMAARLNERIEKLNADMPASTVLQYARNMNSADDPGQGTLSNTLGAESLDKGMMFQKVDFATLKVWKAPELPEPQNCEGRILDFCAGFYVEHAAQVRAVLAGI